jgi:catechol 2,3-dioxygenase-like lactoylglutathione lyase family enzyme
MRLYLTSVFVNDQEKALRFYIDALGFRSHTDIPLGEHRWLTLTAPDDPGGMQLLLEPDAHPAAQAYTAALMADGIPHTSFAVEDIMAETARLKARGVRFTQEPLAMGPVTTAVFDDTCGNLVQIVQLSGT